MPRIRTTPQRPKALKVMLSDSERAMLRELALLQQRSVSDVVRDALARYRQESTTR